MRLRTRITFVTCSSNYNKPIQVEISELIKIHQTHAKNTSCKYIDWVQAKQFDCFLGVRTSPIDIKDNFTQDSEILLQSFVCKKLSE